MAEEIKKIAKEYFKENKDAILLFEKGLDKIFQRNHMIKNHPLKIQIYKLFLEVNEWSQKKK